MLQCQKDARHQRVTSQIALIEQELTELTILEMEQRQLRLDTQMVFQWLVVVIVMLSTLLVQGT